MAFFGLNVVFTAGWVQTAVLEFNEAGDVSFVREEINLLYGLNAQACNLADTSSVGFRSSAGSERLLTGLQLFSDGVPTSNPLEWNQRSMNAAEVKYSALLPLEASTSLPFAIEQLPKRLPAIETLGLHHQIFEPDWATTGNYTTTKDFGPEPFATIPEASRPNRFIIGWCLRSNTTVNGSTRSALLGARSRTYRPSMKIAE